jgi:rhamnulokinase
LELSPKLLPTVVPSGTALANLRADLAKDTRVDNAKVVAACSHELAAALAGLPICKGERWAFLHLGEPTVMGTEIPRPLINDATREMKFSHLVGAGGAIFLHKPSVGLSIQGDCRQYWIERDPGLDCELLNHLAVSAPAFEAFINPHDARFASSEDMPLKVQAYCRETEQPVPRKPGPILRCVLESLALAYRQTLREVEYLTGNQITKLYILGGEKEKLLTHFIANALELPTVVVSEDSASVGNALVQAVALRKLKSLEEARDIIRSSFRSDTIMPHASAWNSAFDRLADLMVC